MFHNRLPPRITQLNLLSPHGVYLCWGHQYGTVWTTTSVNALTIDNVGNIYASVGEAFDFRELSGSNDTNFFIKYDSDGLLQWKVEGSFSNVNLITVNGIAVNDHGDISTIG